MKGVGHILPTPVLRYFLTPLVACLKTTGK